MDLPLYFLSGNITVSSEVTELLTVKSPLKYPRYFPGPTLELTSDEARSEKV